jgi:DNA-binding Lrp family transcriptional regulator
MVNATVLLSVERDRINEIAQELVDMKGISEVYSVAGSWDLVAMVRVHSNEQLADIVTAKMLKVAGILRSETLIAFRVFSKHDLDRMFSVGMD